VTKQQLAQQIFEARKKGMESGEGGLLPRMRLSLEDVQWLQEWAARTAEHHEDMDSYHRWESYLVSKVKVILKD
jgi:hypothetical protein